MTDKPIYELTDDELTAEYNEASRELDLRYKKVENLKVKLLNAQNALVDDNGYDKNPNTKAGKARQAKVDKLAGELKLLELETKDYFDNTDYQRMFSLMQSRNLNTMDWRKK